MNHAAFDGPERGPAPGALAAPVTSSAHLPEVGERVVLACVGRTGDVLHARLLPPDRTPDAPDVRSRNDATAVPTGVSLVARTGLSSDLPVPGEWFGYDVTNTWTFGSTPYLGGSVAWAGRDVRALGLPPCPLDVRDTWTPDEGLETLGLDPDALEPVYDDLLAAGPRRVVELRPPMPAPRRPLAFEEDAILEAAVLRDVGDVRGVEDVLNDLTRRDLRALEAHVAWGEAAFDDATFGGYAGAYRHYAVAVDVAERTSDLKPDDLTPKGWIENRPYLHALHGLGLAAWALGRHEEARRTFARLLWRDPRDGAGARFLIAHLDAG
ncbi:MAG: hypothetical protein RI554_11685, partial [Trueperaceae bacterium]|nr:hypothetical protein [Trueperaceae bacterium]